MSSLTSKELKAKRDSIEKQIASHVPFAHEAAFEKVRAFSAKHQMTEDDLFPAPIDPCAAPGDDIEFYFEKIPFSVFTFQKYVRLYLY